MTHLLHLLIFLIFCLIFLLILSYLDAVKYNADLIWEEYNHKQHIDPNLGKLGLLLFVIITILCPAMVNEDVVTVVLLSLHPPNIVKEMEEEVSGHVKTALAELHEFDSLILLEEGNEKHMADWLEDIPNLSYPTMLCKFFIMITIIIKLFIVALMSWFLTLGSKMTGYNIPGKILFLLKGSVLVMFFVQKWEWLLAARSRSPMRRWGSTWPTWRPWPRPWRRSGTGTSWLSTPSSRRCSVIWTSISSLL